MRAYSITGSEFCKRVTTEILEDVQDNATPSGSAMAMIVLAKLATYTGDAHYANAGEAALAPLQPAFTQTPTGFAWW